MDSKEIAKLLGAQGGKATVKKHGKEYMKELSLKGVKARKNKKGTQAVGKSKKSTQTDDKNMPFSLD